MWCHKLLHCSDWLGNSNNFFFTLNRVEHLRWVSECLNILLVMLCGGVPYTCMKYFIHLLLFYYKLSQVVYKFEPSKRPLGLYVPFGTKWPLIKKVGLLASWCYNYSIFKTTIIYLEILVVIMFYLVNSIKGATKCLD